MFSRLITRPSSRYLLALNSGNAFRRLLHDPAQPPTKVWRPNLSIEDREKLKTLYRNRKKLPPASVPPLPKYEPLSNISKDTIECLSKIRKQGLEEQFYAVLEINTKPYSVTKNDIVITKRLPGTKIGDTIALTNIREIGSREYFVRGNPLVNSRFVNAQAVVMENPRSAKYTKYLKRVGKGGGDRKWRKRSYRDNLTVLRITQLEVNDIQTEPM